MNIKEQILAAKDTESKKIAVKEWGVDVHLKRLSVAETMQFQTTIGNADEKDVTTGLRNMVSYIALCMCDENGQRIFNDDETHLLDTRSTEVIQKLFDEAAKLNGMTNDEKDAEEAKKS